MGKIIIHNESDFSDREAAAWVNAVVSNGFVSDENQYCWHTSFTHWQLNKKASVIAMKTRGETHTFKVRNHD